MNDAWYGPDAATFGDRLAAARDAAGMTPEQLAKRLGVKLKTLKGWENDLNEPRANRLQMLAGMLNVSIMWLLNGEGDGVEAPDGDRPPLSADVSDILSELREVRTQMKANAQRLAVLEKALRLRLQQETA